MSLSEISLCTDKKVLIFSDTHLTHHFDAKKSAYMQKLIAQADLVVLNGDFWDSFQTRYSRFTSSAWKELFPLLKARDCIYLHGNHDLPTTGDGNEFSTQHGISLEITQNGELFHIEHGNRIVPTLDEKMHVPRFILKRTNTIEGIMMRLQGRKFLQSYKKDNDAMLAWKNTHLNRDTWLICGHSHLAIFDETQRFINTGTTNWGIGGYILLEKGVPNLHLEEY